MFAVTDAVLTFTVSDIECNSDSRANDYCSNNSETPLSKC